MWKGYMQSDFCVVKVSYEFFKMKACGDLLLPVCFEGLVITSPVVFNPP